MNSLLVSTAVAKALAAGVTAFLCIHAIGAVLSRFQVPGNLAGLVLILVVEGAAGALGALAALLVLRTQEILDAADYFGRVLRPWRKS